jgi:hypothetical protein
MDWLRLALFKTLCFDSLLRLVNEYVGEKPMWFWDKHFPNADSVDFCVLAHHLARQFKNQIACRDVYRILEYVISNERGRISRASRITRRQFSQFINRFAPFDTCVLTAAHALLRRYHTKIKTKWGEKFPNVTSEFLLCYHGVMTREAAEKTCSESSASSYLVRLSENVSTGVVVTIGEEHFVIERVPGTGWKNPGGNIDTFENVLNHLTAGSEPVPSPFATNWLAPTSLYFPPCDIVSVEPWCENPCPIKEYEYPLSPFTSCWDGAGLVTMYDQTFKLVSEIKVGDRVCVPNGGIDGQVVVATVLLTLCSHVGRIGMVSVGGCWITPFHPVHLQSEGWCFPCHVGKVAMRSVGSVYNFVLDQGHVLEVNGVAGITLAHGSCDHVIAHPFWGTTAVISALRAGLSLGHVLGPWPSLHCGGEFRRLLMGVPELFNNKPDCTFSPALPWVSV